jgi:hypothetical protein
MTLEFCVFLFALAPFNHVYVNKENVIRCIYIHGKTIRNFRYL